MVVEKTDIPKLRCWFEGWLDVSRRTNGDLVGGFLVVGEGERDKKEEGEESGKGKEEERNQKRAKRKGREQILDSQQGRRLKGHGVRVERE